MHFVEIIPGRYLVGVVRVTVAEFGVSLDGTRIVVEIAVIDKSYVVERLGNLCVACSLASLV